MTICAANQKKSVFKRKNYFTNGSFSRVDRHGRFLDYRLHQVLDVRTAENFYYIIGECITNAAKHAEAETVWVSIWDDDKRRLHLTVKDNGKGFDVEKGKKREDIMGFGIEERVRAMKGQFNIKSTKSKGTQIEITVPIQGEMQDE